LQTYETIFITPPNLAEAEEQAITEALAKVISDGGGAIHAQDRMGRRRLAYPIRKFDDGIYVRLLYDAEVEVPKELERRARLSDAVLRSMTVRLTEEWGEHAKQQAVIDAQRRAEAEAEAQREAEEQARLAAEAAARGETPEASEAGASSEDAAPAAESADDAETDADADRPDEE